MGAGTYRVAQGTQVHHDGVTYSEGARVPLEEATHADLIAYWLNAGWIEPAVTTKAARKS